VIDVRAGGHHTGRRHVVRLAAEAGDLGAVEEQLRLQNARASAARSGELGGSGAAAQRAAASSFQP
jgi:hypothetical protein